MAFARRSVAAAILHSALLCITLAAHFTIFEPTVRSAPAERVADTGTWKQLQPLPDPEGFAGVFGGVAGGSLLVAGGANFPNGKPWEGGRKIWSDKIFTLDRAGGHWKVAGKLPRPLGYGVSITLPAGVLCIGGSDSQRHYSDVFLIRLENGQVQFKTLPSLPQTAANCSGALAGDTIYIAGGIETPGSTTALRTFWALDLRKEDAGWQMLEPWPGPERMLAVAGVHDGSFFLFSGAALKPDDNGGPVREWLTDAYRYTPGAGWEKLPDLPRPAVAAPSPAPAIGGRLLVLGGDDGFQVNTPPTAHRGFPCDILSLDPTRSDWDRFEQLPFGLVTTAAIRWNDLVVIPGGEARPGIRSTEVWALSRN